MQTHGLLKRFPIIGQLVDRAINDVYLTMARRPISAVVRCVIDDLQRQNARLPAHQAIPIPRTAALSRAIARQIGRLDPWEVDRARWGRHIADGRHSPTSPQRLATRILERVEIGTKKGTQPIVFGTRFALRSTIQLGTGFAQPSCTALTTGWLAGEGGHGGPIEAENQ